MEQTDEQKESAKDAQPKESLLERAPTPTPIANSLRSKTKRTNPVPPASLRNIRNTRHSLGMITDYIRQIALLRKTEIMEDLKKLKKIAEEKAARRKQFRPRPPSPSHSLDEPMSEKGKSGKFPSSGLGPYDPRFMRPPVDLRRMTDSEKITYLTEYNNRVVRELRDALAKIDRLQDESDFLREKAKTIKDRNHAYREQRHEDVLFRKSVQDRLSDMQATLDEVKELRTGVHQTLQQELSTLNGLVSKALVPSSLG